METITMRLTGTSAMLMHSDKLADPLNPMTKDHKVLYNKTKKTDEDHYAIAKSEWRSSLYYRDVVYVPASNVRSCMVEGGKLSKLGMHLKRGTMILADELPLEYDGPQDPEAMWASGRFHDCRSVVVSGKRLMRYRPLFREWSLTAEVTYDPLVVEAAQVLKSMTDAGRMVGLGDFRPAKGGSFGRFSVTQIG